LTPVGDRETNDDSVENFDSCEDEILGEFDKPRDNLVLDTIFSYSLCYIY